MIGPFGPTNEQAPGCHLIPSEDPELRRLQFLHQELDFTVAHGYSLRKLFLQLKHGQTPAVLAAPLGASLA